MHLRGMPSSLGDGLLLPGLRDKISLRLLIAFDAELTEDYIRSRAGFDQSLTVVEVALDHIHTRVFLLQLRSRGFLTDEHRDGELRMGFGNSMKKVATNVASSASTVQSVSSKLVRLLFFCGSREMSDCCNFATYRNSFAILT